MFKSEAYKYVSERGISLVLKHIYKKNNFTILLIYKFYVPISTFRVSYKATTDLLLLIIIVRMLEI